MTYKTMTAQNLKMASMATSAAANAFAKFPLPFSSQRNLPQTLLLPRRCRPTTAARIYASVSAVTPVLSKPDELVETILSKVVLFFHFFFTQLENGFICLEFGF